MQWSKCITLHMSMYMSVGIFVLTSWINMILL